MAHSLRGSLRGKGRSMPRIFDNIEQQLLPALRQALDSARRADFCVGYFNLRGWKQLDDAFERWAGGDGQGCRRCVAALHSPRSLQGIPAACKAATHATNQN